MTVLAVFKSRAQAIDCVAYVKGAGIPVQTVSTPREAGVGCGLSARFDESFLTRVRFFMGKRSYSSFSGFMRRTGGGGFVYC